MFGNFFNFFGNKTNTDAEAKAVKATIDGIAKVKADAEAKTDTEEVTSEDKEHKDFKEKMQNLKAAIEKQIRPIYNNKIFSNIDEKIFKDNNTVEFKGDPYDIKDQKKILEVTGTNGPKVLNCYNDKLEICNVCLTNHKNNEKKCEGCFVNRNHGRMITKPNLEQILAKCNIDSNKVKQILDDTKQNDKKLNPNQTFNYDDKYLYHMDKIYDEIIKDYVKNYDLYSLCDIINKLYTSLSEKIKIKYTPLFNDNKYLVYTVDDLINRLDQIIKIE
jgi:hypothetical protein